LRKHLLAQHCEHILIAGRIRRMPVCTYVPHLNTGLTGAVKLRWKIWGYRWMQARQTKVSEPDLLVGIEEQVAWCKCTMGKAAPVSCTERVACLLDHFDKELLERTATLYQLLSFLLLLVMGYKVV
jgi:hypothetical protein